MIPFPIRAAVRALLLGGLLFGAILQGAPLHAAKQLPSGPNHRGLAIFDPYLMFPENRPGNGVYLDNRLVLTLEGQTVIDLLPLSVEGRFVYYARNMNGSKVLGMYTLSGDADSRIREVTPGFYHAVMVLDGIIYKKMYRIVDDRILDLLSSSKTADGAVVGNIGVLFYHVASMIREDVEDEPRNLFGLRLHLALFEDERMRHLDYLITNALPRLNISWLDESRIQIGLADGRKEVLSISQFQ